MVEVVKDKWVLGDATCTVVYVIKTSNKDTKIISLTTALNYQRIKFEELQKNYNKNRNKKNQIQ